jgi:lipoate-protein ligase A
MLTGEWLHRQRPSQDERKITIRSGVQVRQKMHKAPGGLIRATVEVQEGVITSASLSGDFFFYPAQRLAELDAALVGVREDQVEERIARYYAEHEIESPGVTPADLAQVLI